MHNHDIQYNTTKGPIVHAHKRNSLYSNYFQKKSQITEFGISLFCSKSVSQNHVLNQLIAIWSQLVE